MNDDPDHLLSAVFINAAGRNPLVIAKVHPQFDSGKVVFRQVLPHHTYDWGDCVGKTVVGWNIEYQTDDVDAAPCHYWLMGAKPLNGPMPSNREYFSWHLSETARANPKQPIHVPQHARFLADALLGINKHPRVALYEGLQDAGLLEQCLVSLYATPQLHLGHVTYSSPALAALESPLVAATKSDPLKWHSMAQIQLPRTTKVIPASQLIPRAIYENSYLSVVAETSPGLDQFFVTEKTGKALAAGRIFLLQGGPGYLRHLRDLGFKTFAPYVDESYDEILDLDDRTAAILAELTRLSKLDLTALYHQLMPVLEHNQNLMYSGKLNDPAKRFLLEIKSRHS